MRKLFYHIIGRFWRWWYSLFSVGDKAVFNHIAFIACKQIWPDARISCPDIKLVISSKDKITNIAKSWPYWSYDFIPELFDCDDYSLGLHFHVRAYRAQEYKAGKVKDDEVYPYAFGQIWGSEMMGVRSPHAVNVFVCNEGVYLIEPQNGNILKADPRRDKAWEVRF